MYYIENIKQLRLYKTQGARSENLAWGPVRYLLRHCLPGTKKVKSGTKECASFTENVYKALLKSGLQLVIQRKGEYIEG